MVDWRQSEEDPDECALRLLQQRVLPVGHPYRHRSYEDCLADADAIDAGVIRGYIRRVAYRTHFTAAASGAVSLPLLLEAVDRIADHWAAAPPQDFLPWETYRMGEGLRGTMAWDPYPLPHTTIAFAGPGVSRMSEDYHAHLVGYSLLGDGPEGARLWDRIRERMGSTYHITAELAPRPHALLSLGQTSTDPAQAERMIEMIMEAYDSMLSDPPTVDQVERCKQRLLGQIALSYGSSLSIVSLLARYQIIGLSLEDLIARTDRLRAVDHGDVVRLLPMTMRSEQLTFAVVGTPA
jgi:zinc protease